MRFPSIDAAAPPKVLVVGDLMIDRYFWGSCDRVSPEAPVQVVAVKRETLSLGGAGNVVANLATLGANVEFVGVVGPDFARSSGPALLDGFRVPQQGLVVDPDRMTTVKSRVVASHQQIVRFDVEMAGAISSKLEAEVLQRVSRLLPGCAVVVLSDYAKGLLTPRVTSEIIALCRKAKVAVLVDPKGSDYSKYRGASLITPNRKEAAVASNTALDSPESVATAGKQLMSSLQLDACLITL
ncbi:MAG TPA: PfkB family carbohydrate kinase, partial [Polyangiales bacterium]|nr:PfkB family carbohydrate kinase [Polyangiales bacterium]